MPSDGNAPSRVARSAALAASDVVQQALPPGNSRGPQVSGFLFRFSFFSRWRRQQPAGPEKLSIFPTVRPGRLPFWLRTLAACRDDKPPCASDGVVFQSFFFHHRPVSLPRRRDARTPRNMTGKLPPKAAEPQFHGRAFDPWNSVAAGHQRAEARGPGGWRENRTHKLNSQLRGGNASGRRVQDAVGPGADPEQPQRTPNAPQPSVLDMLRRPGHAPKPVVARTAAAEDRPAGEAKTRSGIFAGLVVYVNGSTHPLVSDHKLKRLLAEQGARAALHLGRRQVTHVIVGRPAAPGAGGAGGGLAGGKIQREIARARGGCGVKFVGVEWCVRSLALPCLPRRSAFPCCLPRTSGIHPPFSCSLFVFLPTWAGWLPADGEPTQQGPREHQGRHPTARGTLRAARPRGAAGAAERAGRVWRRPLCRRRRWPAAAATSNRSGRSKRWAAACPGPAPALGGGRRGSKGLRGVCYDVHEPGYEVILRFAPQRPVAARARKRTPGWFYGPVVRVLHFPQKGAEGRWASHSTTEGRTGRHWHFTA